MTHLRIDQKTFENHAPDERVLIATLAERWGMYAGTVNSAMVKAGIQDVVRSAHVRFDSKVSPILIFRGATKNTAEGRDVIWVNEKPKADRHQYMLGVFVTIGAAEALKDATFNKPMPATHVCDAAKRQEAWLEDGVVPIPSRRSDLQDPAAYFMTGRIFTSLPEDKLRKICAPY